MNTADPTSSRTISVSEIAQRLNVCEAIVYRMLEKRQIPALRPGRKWLISRVRYTEWERTFGGQAVA